MLCLLRVAFPSKAWERGNKTVIEVKYHSVLNKKQQQLFDNFEAKDK